MVGLSALLFFVEEDVPQSVDIFPTHFFARTSCTRIASSDDVVTNKNTSSSSSSSFFFFFSPRSSSSSKSNQLFTNETLSARFWCPVEICPKTALVSPSSKTTSFFAQYAITFSATFPPPLVFDVDDDTSSSSR